MMSFGGRKNIHALLLLALTWMISFGDFYHPCTIHSKCKCSGHMINCSNLDLTAFLDFSDFQFQDITYMDFSNNNISVISDSQYLPRNLLSLDLSFNNLNSFGNITWLDIHNLKFLNFSFNSFELIPSAVQLPLSLLHLDMSSNYIHSIPENTFHIGSLLQELNLHHNKLVYNRSVFHRNVFRNLSLLQSLNIGSNECLGGEYPDAAFETLVNLNTLIIDGINGASFGKGFSKLKRLKYCKLHNCGLEVITENYFENLMFVENLDFSRSPKTYINSKKEPFLGLVESGAIGKLKNLKVLDISYNLMLGMCAFRNITGDLPRTAVEILIAKKIQCPYGLSTFLTVEDLKPLKNTRLRELYLDENRLEMAEDYSAVYLPKSLEILSLTYNRLRLEKYKVDGVYELTGIHSLYLSFQDPPPNIFDYASWMFCDDFWKTVNCISDRAKVISFDSSSEIVKKQYEENIKYRPYPFPRQYEENVKYRPYRYPRQYEENIKYRPYPYAEPTNCTFDGINFYIMIIPPNTKWIKFEQSNLGDTIAPQFVSNDSLHEIYLNGNDIQYFLGPVCNVSKVTIFDISDNMCLNISSYFFIGFTGLKELYLQGNQLGEVINRFQNGDIFQSQSDLRILNMASNRIQTLPEHLLINICNLEMLNVSNNLLTNFNLSISHLKNLKLIDLSFNQITFLSETSFHRFNNLVTAELKIDILENNLECSCDAFSFLRWCDKHKYILEYYDNYTCRYTENKNIAIPEAVLKLEKQCFSKIGIIVAVSACIILMLGITIGSVLYRYRWHMRYWFYGVKRKYLHNYAPLTDLTNFRFDAFVSYADSDRDFVFADMIENLEKTCGRTLCIHQRDFIPGSDIADNIINAIHQSRKTICLLSRDFLKSEWCKYELQMAQIEGILSRDGENIIIIVMLEDIPEHALPNRIVEIMKDVTYVPFYDFNQHREDICKNLNTALDY